MDEEDIIPYTKKELEDVAAGLDGVKLEVVDYGGGFDSEYPALQHGPTAAFRVVIGHDGKGNHLIEICTVHDSDAIFLDKVYAVLWPADVTTALQRYVGLLLLKNSEFAQ